MNRLLVVKRQLLFFELYKRHILIHDGHRGQNVFGFLFFDLDELKFELNLFYLNCLKKKNFTFQIID